LKRALTRSRPLEKKGARLHRRACNGNLGLLAPIRHYIETLVHPAALQDVLTAARHRAFIAPRLLGSVVALACFPIYLLVRGTPSTMELMAFAWLIVPILIA